MMALAAEAARQWEAAMNVYQSVKDLVCYGLRTGLIEKDDEVYAQNRILAVMGLDSYEDPGRQEKLELNEILDSLLDDAAERGVLEDNSIVSRDLFDTALMDCLVERPSSVRRKFDSLYKEDPEEATDWYYQFSQDTNYIRSDRIKKDIKWKTDTEYGPLDITINLSKPEKDPKAIAAARSMPQAGYPKCLLCLENEGYEGRLNHPARQNHRVIPLTLDGEQYYFQYSPYVYYNEHCIIFNKKHVPMKIDGAVFRKLFSFLKQFPHYTIGSNADLPIVGGSILSHDHFQGGRYSFPMAAAEEESDFSIAGFEDVHCSILKWPLSVIRLKSGDAGRLSELSEHILGRWRAYTDKEAFIFAETDGEPHNTITPIARFRNGLFEIDLCLRNNITTEDCPLGYYHPHSALHHIKKENIGLIEVMGLAILPARLKEEMALLREAVLKKKDIRSIEALEKHADWAESFIEKEGLLTEENIDAVIRREIGLVFKKVLEDCGVFKADEDGRAAFRRFTGSL